MTARELVVLGTASMAPTRYRNHNGYLLRWDDEGILFDPGEGTQRQCTLAGVRASQISRICVTHFHGDHCLGVPGMLQRLSLDGVERPVTAYFPASGVDYFRRLRYASSYVERATIVERPTLAGAVDDAGAIRVVARRLDHQPDTLGWRIEEPDGVRMDRARLDAAGVRGADVRRLQTEGELTVGGRRVRLEDVSEERVGQKVAFVMDTRVCDDAFELAADVDMLVAESTFVSGEEDMAERKGHLTAAQAARIAREAGARLLVLTHFSQRHPDAGDYVADARRVFPHVVAAHDLARIPVPHRR